MLLAASSSKYQLTCRLRLSSFRRLNWIRVLLLVGAPVEILLGTAPVSIPQWNLELRVSIVDFFRGVCS